MPVTYPNRICTCGYTRFRERRTPASSSVDRWMLFDTTALSGFGSTPFGTFFGAGSGGLWGKFTGTFKSTTLDVVCESCARVRTTKTLGGITPFATFVSNGYMGVIASDVGTATCFSLRFTGPDGTTYDVQLALLPGVPPPPALVSDIPTETAETPPAGAILANSLLQARLPEVAQSGLYTVELIDRCSGTSTTIAAVTLEVPPMILSPLDADLGGAPRQWLYGQSGKQPGSMPASGSRISVPFDKCTVVHEYDARLGTLPGTQGWTHNGGGSPGDFTLVEGGGLRGTTVAASNWLKQTVVGSAVGSVYSYAVMMPMVDTARITNGDGPGVVAMYSTALAAPHKGVFYNMLDQKWYGTKLDFSSDSALSTHRNVAGWNALAAATDGTREQVWVDDTSKTLNPSVFVNAGDSAGALEVISGFGAVNGNGSDAIYRNVVNSFGGRFIRAFFGAYAAVTNPVLRLYLMADANASALKTAHFLVRFGPITGDPYAIPAGSAEATVNFSAADTVYETPITLAGLTAGLPFWFSVERQWDHGDDSLAATAHLIQLSVRSS